MRAALLVGAQKFELTEVDDPVLPDDGLIVDIKACGICGSDIRRWREGPPDAGGIIPGHEAAGIVSQVGKDLRDFQVGDRIAIAPDVHCGKCYYCKLGKFNLCDDLILVGITPGYPGGFAEKLALTGNILTNGIVHKMPEELSFLDAALSEPLCSVIACHEKAQTHEGQTVLVMGAGPIGCLHIVIAKSKGARVIVSEPNHKRRQMSEVFDPDLVIDPSNEDLAKIAADYTNGIGPDIIICANTLAVAQAHAVEIVRKAGKVMLFGGLPKANPLTTLNGNKIHYGEIEVIGSFSYYPDVHIRALNLLSKKVIPTEKLITHKFFLEEINKAYQIASSGEGLKVVVTV